MTDEKNMIELPIGTKFWFNGKQYEVCRDEAIKDNCEQCAFNNMPHMPIYFVCCLRHDCLNTFYREVKNK